MFDVRKGKKVSMKKLIAAAASLALLAFVIAGCGKPIGTQTGATSVASTGCTGGKIEMGSVNFVQQTCTIKAGSQVTFVDPASTGGYHVLCLGKDQNCVSNANGPAALNTSGGVVFNQGDPPKSYTFATAGTYTVTCTVHTNMNVTITVQ
jgi:plastocyanin